MNNSTKFRFNSKILLLAILISPLLFYSTSCNKEVVHETIPNVSVNVYIDVYSTMYINLSIIGGHEFIYGGYKGIVVYRLSETEFLAFDRACSYDPTNECRLIMPQGGLNLQDTCCTSKFAILDGAVISGPATLPLKQYHTTFDGATLHIFN